MNSQPRLQIPNRPDIDSQLHQVDIYLSECIDNCPPAFKSLVIQTAKPGKRLRPLILLLAGSPAAQTVPAAAAVELIHKASMLHDNIIDHHTGKDQLALNLMAGDFLLTKAFQIVGSIDNYSLDQLADCVVTMAAGQAITGYLADPGDELYLKSAAQKTASLFAAAGTIGGHLGGLMPSVLQNYGLNFGLAFQIIDDIHDGDFPKLKIDSAKSAANKYMQKAKRALVGLPDGPTKDALNQTTDIYLTSALS